MITLYGMASPNVLKIVLMLEEVGLPYRFEHVDVVDGVQHTPEFRALNPNGRVPVIVDPDGPGGAPFTVFESGAILMYLADKTGLLWPAEPRARHTVTQWLMIQMGGVGPMFGQAVHFIRIAPPGNEYGLSRYRSEAKRLYGVLDRRLGESAYLGGADYSIADVATINWAGYHEMFGIDLPEFPHVGRWMAEIAARPAAQRMMAKLEEIRAVDGEKFANATPDQIDRLVNRGKYALA